MVSLILTPKNFDCASGIYAHPKAHEVAEARFQRRRHKFRNRVLVSEGIGIAERTRAKIANVIKEKDPSNIFFANSATLAALVALSALARAAQQNNWRYLCFTFDTNYRTLTSLLYFY